MRVPTSLGVLARDGSVCEDRDQATPKPRPAFIMRRLLPYLAGQRPRCQRIGQAHSRRDMTPCDAFCCVGIASPAADRLRIAGVRPRRCHPCDPQAPAQPTPSTVRQFVTHCYKLTPATPDQARGPVLSKGFAPVSRKPATNPRPNGPAQLQKRFRTWRCVRQNPARMSRTNGEMHRRIRHLLRR